MPITAYPASSDYEIVTKLKSFSDKYGVCLLVVHHTRKLESEDSFDMISGTNGLLGAADDIAPSLFLLDNSTAEAPLPHDRQAAP